MTFAATRNQTREIPAKLVCEACGVEFSCGANVGVCWCFAVETAPENLAVWRERYENCLCENCLRDAENRVIEDKKLIG